MYEIQVMINLAKGGEFFQTLYHTFDTEEAAQAWINEARSHGWTWPDYAIIWKN